MAYRNVEDGLVVHGLTGMHKALQKADHALGPELKKRLKHAGANIVAPKARTLAPNGTRPHAGPKLATTIKTGVTQKGAWVASTSPYGGVQNYGGRVGHNHQTVLTRGMVSGYMTRAVKDTQEPVTKHVEGVLDWLTRELDK